MFCLDAGKRWEKEKQDMGSCCFIRFPLIGLMLFVLLSVLAFPRTGFLNFDF